MKVRLVRTACAPAITQAPGAPRRRAGTGSPTIGERAPDQPRAAVWPGRTAQRCRGYRGSVSAIPDQHGQHAEDRGDLDHRCSTVTFGIARRSSATAIAGGELRVERPCRRRRRQSSGRRTRRRGCVIELVSMNCMRRPALEARRRRSAPIASVGPWAHHADCGDDCPARSARMVSGVGEPVAVAVVQVDRREHAPRHVGAGPGGGQWGGVLSSTCTSS